MPKSKNIFTISNYWAYIWFVLIIFLGISVFRVQRRLPEPVKISNNSIDQNHVFVEERAKDILEKLVKIGPRVIGSPENEQLAVSMITEEVERIKKSMNQLHRIETDVQVVSGNYHLEFKPVGLTILYRNLQNIAVKLGPKDEKDNEIRPSLLLNCHFDSVPLSPGASDNGINCAIMLELLNVLSKSPQSMEANVIFLFNGGEENALQAAHGFIDQHPWFRQVKAVLNLEAGGAGGHITVFQSSPKSPWLLKHFARVAPDPHAFVMIEEIFQANLIPSDTDFRLFRDFGNVAGLDLIFYGNTYVYHTRYDTIEQITPGSFQQAGDNFLVFIKSLISSDDFKHPENFSHGNLVFFNVLNVMILYSEELGILVNLLAIFGAVFLIYQSVKRIGGPDIYLRVFLSSSVQFIGWSFGIVFGIAVGIVLDKFECSLSWFSRPWLVLGLYVLPNILGMFVPLLAYDYYHHNSKLGSNINTQIHIYGNMFCWISLLFLGTMFKIRSSFLCMIIVTIQTISSTLTLILRQQYSVRGWMWIYLLMLMFPVALVFGLLTDLLVTMIPIVGRIGSGKNAEQRIGLLTAFGTLLCAGVFVPLVTILEKPSKIIKVLIVGVIVAMVAVLFTPLQIPFGDDPQNPTPQRFLIYHTQRTFFDINGQIRNSDSGYLFWNSDRNSPKSIEQFVPEVRNAICLGTKCNDEEIFCGLPIYKTRIYGICDEATWIPSESPSDLSQVRLNLTSVDIFENSKRYNFYLEGPHHMNLIISPKQGSKLVHWSFTDEIPEANMFWNKRPIYFLTMSYGKILEPEIFSIDITGNEGFDLGINGYLMDTKTLKPDFQRFISRFPKWAHVTPFESSYYLWTF